ncbi:hypothetical protein [Polaromonas sp. YR568]|uniref:hypothetical protein n=1 Tax=Polaromonas sp. YR568 TaxID=1855301 RepID=UPI00398BE1D0
MSKTPEDASQAAAAEAIAQQQVRHATLTHELERTRRAALFWRRQRATFLGLLVESMDEFDISQAELVRARRAHGEPGKDEAAEPAAEKEDRRDGLAG